MAFLCLLLASSCSKNPDAINPPGNGNAVTPVGTPNGTATTKTIGTNGGEIATPDGRIRVTIPAGALTGPKEISIQPITGQLPSGVGTAYRLTPHGEQFNQPVTITFNYQQEDLANTLPEFLDIAFQDADGSWKAMTNTTVDKLNRKISTTTTHFSDWTYFKSLRLDPEQATVQLGGSVDLKVTTTFPYLDPDDAPSGEPTVPVYTEPRELRPDEILGWSYAGDGILVSQAAKAFYTAPDQLPSANPEAVTARINLHRKGQFLLISNITVLANNNVVYLQVDEDWLKPTNNHQCTLYIYGTFGNDPGQQNRSVTIDGTMVTCDLWTPTLIRCRIDRVIHGPIQISANGQVVASSVLRKFTGNFLYERFHGGVLNAGSPNPLKEVTKFKFVYRGFGKPQPDGIPFFIPFEGSLADGTEANFTISGSASVTMPGPCGLTSSVTIPTSSGIQPMNPLSLNTQIGFKCEVTEKEGGIDVDIFYVINDVATNVIVHRSDCNISFDDPPKNIWAGLSGFTGQPISLVFDGTTGLKLRGTNELQSGLISSGILVEAWDGTGNPSHYTTDGLMRAKFRND